MQNILQNVGIEVVLSVEVLQHKPVGIKNLFRPGTMDGIQHTGFKVVVGHTVLRAAADIVEPVPERDGHGIPTHPFQQTSGILHGGPLQHTTDGDVEHNRVEILQDGGVKDARLSQAHPVTEAGIGEDALSLDLTDRVIVECAGEDGIAAPPPMEGFVAV